MSDTIRALEAPQASQNGRFAAAHKGMVGIPAVASYQVEFKRKPDEAQSEAAIDLNRAVGNGEGMVGPAKADQNGDQVPDARIGKLK